MSFVMSKSLNLWNIGLIATAIYRSLHANDRRRNIFYSSHYILDVKTVLRYGLNRRSRSMDAGTRKRRPAFDREQGVEIAQKLFHARGYDAVGAADLTAALGIVPPSLYAAYGSKAEL